MRSLFILGILIFKLPAYAQTDLTARMASDLVLGQHLSDLLSTVDHGLRVYYPEKSLLPVTGYFPVFENNRYKLVYITTEPKLMIVGTVSFNADFDSSETRIDTTTRDFSPVEYETAALHITAVNEHSSDTSYHKRPHSSLISIPMITAYGRKVYIFNWLENTTACQFGNDWEYTFGSSTDEIIAKKKIHQHITELDPSDATAVHSHYGENIEGLPVHDIALFCFSNWFHKRVKFITADENKVLELDLIKDRLLKYTHSQYAKTGHSLPQR